MKSTIQQLAAFLASLCTAVCAAQIDAEPIEFSTAEGTARGWIAVVDLTDPAVRVEALVRVTDKAGVAEAVSPEAWMADSELRLVVNANYFGAKPDNTATIVGLCIADGAIVSSPRSYEGAADPAVVFTRDGLARIGAIGAGELSDAVAAVAGVGGSANSGVPGTLLVDDGVSLGETARVQPTARHPRTAIGVTRDGGELLIVVIDGRQEGWSVGMTLPELAELLTERGAWDAVNLDGGGSTAMLLRQGDEIESNRPSDAGGFRPVAVSLGIRVGEMVPASQAGGE